LVVNDGFTILMAGCSFGLVDHISALTVFQRTSLESIQFAHGHLRQGELRLNRRCADSDLRQLSVLPADGIQSLDLADSRITDAGLADLPALPKLESLDLSGTAVSDSGLACLARFPALGQLNLSDTAIGDAGLAPIAGLADLADLDLTETRVSDAGLGQLAACRKLERLVLAGTLVTGTGLAALKQLDQLAARHSSGNGRRHHVGNLG